MAGFDTRSVPEQIATLRTDLAAIEQSEPTPSGERGPDTASFWPERLKVQYVQVTGADATAPYLTQNWIAAFPADAVATGSVDALCSALPPGPAPPDALDQIVGACLQHRTGYEPGSQSTPAFEVTAAALQESAEAACTRALETARLSLTAPGADAAEVAATALDWMAGFKSAVDSSITDITHGVPAGAVSGDDLYNAAGLLARTTEPRPNIQATISEVTAAATAAGERTLSPAGQQALADRLTTRIRSELAQAIRAGVAKAATYEVTADHRTIPTTPHTSAAAALLDLARVAGLYAERAELDSSYAARTMPPVSAANMEPFLRDDAAGMLLRGEQRLSVWKVAVLHGEGKHVTDPNLPTVIGAVETREQYELARLKLGAQIEVLNGRPPEHVAAAYRAGVSDVRARVAAIPPQLSKMLREERSLGGD